MFTLGIPNSQQRRANSVLTHDRSTPVEYEVYKQDKDFHIFTFDVDYDGFKDVVILLKKNGISTIGADDQLTERKIMKLTNLLEQRSIPIAGMEDTKSKGFGNDNKIKSIDQVVQVLTNILKTWETKEYNSPTERYEEYYMDIEDLVKELTNQSPSRDGGIMTDDEADDLAGIDLDEKKRANTPSGDMAYTQNVNESFQLRDFFINENVETLMVKLGGDEKTELKISNQTDSTGAVDLSNVTLEFKGEKYEGLEFKFEEVLEDHDNEGKDALFVAESDDKIFEVEVNIDANYDQSGIIDDVEWRSLETFPKGKIDEKIDDKAALKKSAKGMAMYGAQNEQYSLKDFFTNE